MTIEADPRGRAPDGRGDGGPLPQDAVASPAAHSILGRVALGATLMIGARLVIRGISVLGMLVTARLLLPEDFGLIMLAAAAVAVTEVLAVTGYGQVLVRHASTDRALYDTAFTLNLIRSALLAGLVAATADWQAGLMGDPRIGPILQVSALIILLDGCTSIGLHRLQRELAFDGLFRFQVATKLAAFVVSVALAVLLQNYWCLILGNLAAKLVSVPYSYRVAPHRPRLSLRHARELLHFSKWMLAISACATADSHGLNLVIGRLAGVPALGTYQLSYFLAAVPVHEIAVPVRGPIYAGYAKVQHDRDLLRRHFLDGFGFLAAVMVPLSVGLALTAPQATRLALGPDWAHAVPVVALCALFSLADCLAAFSTNVFFVLDRLAPYVRTLALLVLLRLPAVAAAAALWGVTGVAAVMLGTAVLNALVWHRQVARLLGHGISEVGSALWRSLAAAAAMSAVVLALQASLPPGPLGVGQAALELALLAGAGAATHISAQWLLWRAVGAPEGAEQRLLALAGRVPGWWRARLAARHP
jgi:O-antigen/teichoic acid export membrane protein